MDLHYRLARDRQHEAQLRARQVRLLAAMRCQRRADAAARRARRALAAI